MANTNVSGAIYKNFLGWARGKNKAGDETGVWHAVVEAPRPVSGPGRDAPPTARAACSEKQLVAGQLEQPPVGARFCQRIGCDNIRRQHFNSWNVEALADGEWCANGLYFATRAEAVQYAADLLSRWMGCSDTRAVPHTAPVNYRWNTQDGLVSIERLEQSNPQHPAQEPA